MRFMMLMIPKGYEKATPGRSIHNHQNGVERTRPSVGRRGSSAAMFEITP